MTGPIRKLVLATLAALAVVAPALALALPDEAEGRWVIRGKGWGHGVGMSQYGAQGFARHGRNHRQILRHYYRNTNIGRISSRRVRVLLKRRKRVRFTNARKACGRRLRPNRRYKFRGGSRVVLMTAKGNRLRRCGKQGNAKGRGPIRIFGSGRYRGALSARANGSGLMVINAVSIEGYIKGVVANEVPASWHQQALRAQAVAARSYGVATSRSGPFDHYDDTRSQVYGGVSSETRRTNRAVKATSRRVVRHNGKAAITYFFSTSGGRTEAVQFGFPGASRSPYLKSVRDPHDNVSPVHRWRVRYSHARMKSRLTGLFRGNLLRIRVLKRGRSPRIVRARVVGSRGSSRVSGAVLRDRLDLRSTWARFRRN